MKSSSHVLIIYMYFLKLWCVNEPTLQFTPLKQQPGIRLRITFMFRCNYFIVRTYLVGEQVCLTLTSHVSLIFRISSTNSTIRRVVPNLSQKMLPKDHQMIKASTTRQSTWQNKLKKAGWSQGYHFNECTHGQLSVCTSTCDISISCLNVYFWL